MWASSAASAFTLAIVSGIFGEHKLRSNHRMRRFQLLARRSVLEILLAQEVVHSSAVDLDHEQDFDVQVLENIIFTVLLLNLLYHSVSI